MLRCFDIAKKGGNAVKSNPIVGSVLTYNDRIIGEGYHRRYGAAHAEVNTLDNVKSAWKKSIKQATLYVSLEPCNHTGKTPPCVDAIINSGVKRVVISSLDPNPKMQGRSIKILKSAGIRVDVGILREQGDELINRYRNNINGLPHVTIKFAQSHDFYIGRKDERTLISDDEINIFTHKLRAENDAVLVGTNTVIVDNPILSTRHYPGKSPLRIILDRNERIPKSKIVLADSNKTLIVTSKKQYKSEGSNKNVISILNWDLENILRKLYLRNVRSILVEGGAKIINWFSEENLWHEAFIIKSNKDLGKGIKAPRLKGGLRNANVVGNDTLHHIWPEK